MFASLKSLDEVETFAKEMLGKTLVTVQTGAAGRVVNRLYIEDGSAIARELYLSALVDRSASRVAFIVSEAGGMNIEEVAHDTPEKIHTLTIDPATGYQPFHGRKVAFALGLKGDQVKACGNLVENLYRMVVEKDMSLLEINPLVVTKEGKLICLDGKMNFDSNALYRHPDIVAMRDLGEEDPTEIEASKHDLAFVKLDGNIGCLVNGAGLAMATMDIIKLYGAEPANFLDVGGGASKEKVQAAFKIILADPAVKGILVNIFGGIMRCDIIAEGVVAAAREMHITVPLVVRLEGTNVELGKKILNGIRPEDHPGRRSCRCREEDHRSAEGSSLAPIFAQTETFEAPIASVLLAAPQKMRDIQRQDASLHAGTECLFLSIRIPRSFAKE